MEISEKIRDCLGLEGRGGGIGAGQTVFIMVSTSHHKFPQPMEYAPPRVYCSVNFGFW